MNLREAVAALPATTVEITQLFFELGIKGVPEKADACPIAVWLQSQTGEPVRVDRDAAWVSGDGAFVRLPDSAAQFVEEFDDGELVGREALLA